MSPAKVPEMHTASHLGAIRQALRVVRSAVRNGEPS